MGKKPASGGFTLIELLVVIAIVTILAGLCFPVYAKAREKGRSAVCLSNLRQLAMAMHMYATDHECATRCCPGGTFSPWWENVQAYIGNREIIRCPSDIGVERFDEPMRWPSYGWNCWLCGRPYAAMDRGDCTERAMLVDANATKIMKPEHLQVSDDKGTPPGRIVPRHLGGCNVSSFSTAHPAPKS